MMEQITDLSFVQCFNVHNCGHVAFLEEQLRQANLKIQKLEQKVDELTLANELLKGRLRNEVKTRFDKKSEKLEYMQTPDSNAQNPSITEDKAKAGEVIDNPPTSVGDESKTALPDVAKKVKKITPHWRNIPDNLPVVEEICTLPEDQCSCPKCGKKYRKTVLFEESCEIDIEIKVFKKIYKRQKYASTCNCENMPVIITAPKPSNIIYKSLYSTRLWSVLLVLKYYSQIPLYRQVNNIWGQYGEWFSNSTIIGGFKKLIEILKPLYNKLIEVSRQEEHWHADETRWKVFGDKRGKKTFNCWMWVFASAKVVVYVLDRTRSSEVPKKHFGDNASGIINVDRYAAYHILAEMITRALCWYHTRRDFVSAAKSFPELLQWSLEWLERIHVLETINDARVAALKDEDEFGKQQKLLEEQISAIQDACVYELTQNIKPEQKKVLKSLVRNWEGLTVFVSNPLVPMHNNLAERVLRPLALGRNNYYGSRSEWSGQLAAICMSICKTAEMHGLNPQAYIEFYFNICAANDSRAPDNLDSLLPWNLTEEVIDAHNLRKPKKKAS